jgi:hypothetical protein
MQALEKKPERRPSSMQELARELQKIEESLSNDLPQTMPVNLGPRKAKLTRFLIGGGITGLLLLGGTAAYWNLSRSQSPMTISMLEVLADKNEIEMGDSVSLKARARAADGHVMEVVKGLEWTSSDPSIAEIDAEGKLVAKSSGTAKILARLDEIVAPAITLTVKERMSTPRQADADIVALVVRTNTARLQIKQRVLLKVKARYSNGTERDVNEGIDWQSSDSTIVTIDASGDAEGQKEGKAVITAQLGHIKAEPVLISVHEIGASEPKPAAVKKILDENQNGSSGPGTGAPLPHLPAPPAQKKPQEMQFAPSGNSKNVVSDYIRNEQERRRR